MNKVHYEFRTSRITLPSTFQNLEEAQKWLSKQNPLVAKSLKLFKVTTIVHEEPVQVAA